MCFFPKYRFPVPEEAVLPEFRKRYGWSNKSHAFIFDKRDSVACETLSTKYRKYLDLLEEIPCGQCAQCRIRYTKELAQRALAESTMHEDNYFITLTYDNEHLSSKMLNTFSRVGSSVDSHGARKFLFGPQPNLVRRDFQLFAKNLRKYIFEKYGKTIRIFYCGEYGPKNGRPHFHAIIYGCPLPDLKFYKNVDNNAYYTSQIISDAWKDYASCKKKDKSDASPRGYAVVTNVTWDTCAYVAGYVAKKFVGKLEKTYEDICRAAGCEPLAREFHQGGKNPGLGLEYYDAHKDKIYKFDEVTLPGMHARPCRYYDSKYDIDYPEDLDSIKEVRKNNALLAKAQEYKAAGVSTPEAIQKYEEQKKEAFLVRYKRKGVTSRNNI